VSFLSEMLRVESLRLEVEIFGLVIELVSDVLL